MFKFVHAADLHIDSPLEGLAQYEGAPVTRIRVATREAVQNLVRLAVREEAKFVLFSGDIYDGDWRDFNTGLFFASQLAELAQHGVKAFVLHGNHDAESRITRSLPLPDNTTVFGSAHPETYDLADLEVAIHGQSYDRPDVRDDLQARYPPPRAGVFNIGMLHTAAGRSGHHPYAPCSVEDLKAKGYDYWALGHVHTREVLWKDPWIVFPGNTQGRHARELGPRGCSVVTVEGQRVTAVMHHDLDVVRWVQLDLDASRADSVSDLLDLVHPRLAMARDEAGERLLAVRFVVGGSTAIHGDLVRNVEAFAYQVRARATELRDVWVEKVLVQTKPKAVRPAAVNEAVGSLMSSLDAMKADPEVRAELAAIVDQLRAKLASVERLTRPEGALGSAAIEDALDGAVELVRAKLGGTPE